LEGRGERIKFDSGKMSSSRILMQLTLQLLVDMMCKSEAPVPEPLSPAALDASGNRLLEQKN
jgi:hypothetical protein